MTYQELAKTIVEKIGGSENVTLYTHCITRLRFVLKDKSKVDEAGLREIKEIMGIVDRGGQYQLVIGGDVERVFNELPPFLPNVEQDKPADEAGDEDAGQGKEKTQEKKNVLQTVMSYVSASIAPTITVIVAAGLINALLAIAVQFFGMDNQGSTYTAWSSFSQIAFSYLPVWLAFSAARYLKTDSFVSAFVSAAAILVFSNAEGMTMFGLTIPTVNYSGAIVPVLLMVPVLAGYIAYSIADRPGLAVGFTGGLIAANGNALLDFTHIDEMGGFQHFLGNYLFNNSGNTVSGFLGGLAAGFLAGFIVLGLEKLCSKLPPSLEGIKPTLIYPLVGIFVISVLMYFIFNPIIGIINTWLSNMLLAISGA